MTARQKIRSGRSGRTAAEDLTMTPAFLGSADSSGPPSPTMLRADLTRSQSNLSDERTPLLQSSGRSRIRIQSGVDSGKTRLSRHHSFSGMPVLSSSTYTCYVLKKLTAFIAGSLRSTRHHSRAGSWGQRLVTALTHNDSMRESKGSLPGDDTRVWYDQFTSTDWVHDSIADAYRVKALRSRTDIRGRIEAFFDGTQGWILSALVGFLTAILAYIVDVSEAPVFDWKDGYCSDGFLINEKVSWPSSLFLHCPCSRAPNS